MTPTVEQIEAAIPRTATWPSWAGDMTDPEERQAAAEGIYALLERALRAPVQIPASGGTFSAPRPEDFHADVIAR